MWKLQGVVENDKTSMIISSQGQVVEWNGLRLHIHQSSLPEKVHQCKLHIKASVAGEYELPEDTDLVSGVFWLRCEPQCEFAKPITVEIQHCSTKRDLSRLEIIRASCSQKQLPYRFKPLGGRFDADTFYGTVEVKSFSALAVGEKHPSSILYHNQIFYRDRGDSQPTHDIHITFVMSTELHINVSYSSYC